MASCVDVAYLSAGKTAQVLSSSGVGFHSLTPESPRRSVPKSKSAFLQEGRKLQQGSSMLQADSKHLAIVKQALQREGRDSSLTVKASSSESKRHFMPHASVADALALTPEDVMDVKVRRPELASTHVPMTCDEASPFQQRKRPLVTRDIKSKEEVDVPLPLKKKVKGESKVSDVARGGDKGKAAKRSSTKGEDPDAQVSCHLAAFGEPCQLGGQSFKLPPEALFLRDPGEVFSIDTWFSEFTDEERETLTGLLPGSLDVDDPTEIVADLFEKPDFFFGSPVLDFWQRLRRGRYHPQLKPLVDSFHELVRKKHFQEVRDYQHDMVESLGSIKNMWEKLGESVPLKQKLEALETGRTGQNLLQQEFESSQSLPSKARQPRGQQAKETTKVNPRASASPGQVEGGNVPARKGGSVVQPARRCHGDVQLSESRTPVAPHRITNHVSGAAKAASDVHGSSLTDFLRAVASTVHLMCHSPEDEGCIEAPDGKKWWPTSHVLKEVLRTHGKCVALQSQQFRPQELVSVALRVLSSKAPPGTKLWKPFVASRKQGTRWTWCGIPSTSTSPEVDSKFEWSLSEKALAKLESRFKEFLVASEVEEASEVLRNPGLPRTASGTGTGSGTAVPRAKISKVASKRKTSSSDDKLGICVQKQDVQEHGVQEDRTGQGKDREGHSSKSGVTDSSCGSENHRSQQISRQEEDRRTGGKATPSSKSLMREAVDAGSSRMRQAHVRHTEKVPLADHAESERVRLLQEQLSALQGQLSQVQGQLKEVQGQFEEVKGKSSSLSGEDRSVSPFQTPCVPVLKQTAWGEQPALNWMTQKPLNRPLQQHTQGHLQGPLQQHTQGLLQGPLHAQSTMPCASTEIDLNLGPPAETAAAFSAIDSYRSDGIRHPSADELDVWGRHQGSAVTRINAERSPQILFQVSPAPLGLPTWEAPLKGNDTRTHALDSARPIGTHN